MLYTNETFTKYQCCILYTYFCTSVVMVTSINSEAGRICTVHYNSLMVTNGVQCVKIFASKFMVIELSAVYQFYSSKSAVIQFVTC